MKRDNRKLNARYEGGSGMKNIDDIIGSIKIGYGLYYDRQVCIDWSR